MTRNALAGLALTGVMLVACSGDDGEEAAPASTATAAAPEATEEATPAPPPETGEGDQRSEVYRVKRGDTLSAIADRFDTTVERLARLNDIDNPNEIRAGDRLKIPRGN